MSLVRLHAAFALLASFPVVAAAQTDPKVEASQHFDRGLSLAKQKSYLEAIKEFNRAYQLSPHFTVMYNLGQAYVAIEQPVYAAEALQRYLAGGKDEVPKARRRQVEATIAAQERRIATVTFLADLPGALVRVDGLEVGRTPLAAPVRLAAGGHRLDAVLPGYRPWERKVELAGREQRSIEIRLVPLTPLPPAAAPATALAAQPMPQPSPAPVSYSAPPVVPPTALGPGPVPAAAPAPATVAPVPVTTSQPTASPPATSPVAAATAPSRHRGRHIAAALVGSVGIGALVAGSVLGLQAFSKKSSSDDQCPSEQCTADGVRLNDEAKTAATASTITFGVGLACVAVATYLLLTPRRPSDAPPGSLAQTIRVTPTASPHAAALVVGGAW